jgi:hypothetical protein
MFNRRERAPGDRRGWAKRLSAMVAGVGGVGGGLARASARRAEPPGSGNSPPPVVLSEVMVCERDRSLSTG